MTVIHNGIRYHDEDAKALGITADSPSPKTTKRASTSKSKAQRSPAANKAQSGPAHDKAQTPVTTTTAAGKPATTEGADGDGGSNPDGADASAARES